MHGRGRRSGQDVAERESFGGERGREGKWLGRCASEQRTIHPSIHPPLAILFRFGHLLRSTLRITLLFGCLTFHASGMVCLSVEGQRIGIGIGIGMGMGMAGAGVDGWDVWCE